MARTLVEVSNTSNPKSQVPQGREREPAEASASLDFGFGLSAVRSPHPSVPPQGVQTAGSAVHLRRRLLALQRSHGNQFVRRMVERGEGGLEPGPSPRKTMVATPVSHRQTLARADRGTRERLLPDLQRGSGNRAVGQLLSKTLQEHAPLLPAVQCSVVQRDKPKLKKTQFDRAAVEAIKTNAESRHESITTFIRESRGTLQIYKSRLLAAATLYKAAFGRHKAVLDEAKQSAADRKQMISTLAGFAVGVVLGVPGAVARMGLKELAEKAVKAFAVGGELAELVVGKTAAWAAGVPDAKAFEPTAEIPELKELAVWRTLAEMSDKLLGISLLTAKQMKIVSAAGTAVTEIRLREGGAKNLEKTDAELLALVQALKSADEASQEVEAGLRGAKAEIDELGATPARHMTVEEVEQDIWIEWIADLTDDDLLDEDDITDHLEHLGVIGEGRRVWDDDAGEWRREPPRLDVDFGSWVSDEDEEDAVNAARAKLGRHAAASSGGSYYYDDE